MIAQASSVEWYIWRPISRRYKERKMGGKKIKIMDGNSDLGVMMQYHNGRKEKETEKGRIYLVILVLVNRYSGPQIAVAGEGKGKTKAWRCSSPKATSRSGCGK